MVDKKENKTARYEIRATVGGERATFFADKADLIEGWVTFTPKLVIISSGRGERKNVEITLPAHAVESISEYKPARTIS